MKRIKEAVKEYYGKRCLDFEPECVVCQAWAEFDEAKRAVGIERRRRKIKIMEALLSIDTRKWLATDKEKDRLMSKWVDEEYSEATDEQKANLLKLFKEV